MKKDIWIVVIILCVFGILAVVYKVWLDGKNGLLEKFFSKKTMIEKYENPVILNNLVVNGAFNNGQPPSQFSGSYGDAEIIVFKNNGSSSYVLKLASAKTLRPTDPIFYRMDFSLKPNSIYFFGCLYLTTRDNPLINIVVFNKNNKIILKSEEDKNYNYVKQGDFRYRYSLFKTPVDNNNIKTTIYMGYNYNSMEGFNYYTDLGLYELVQSDTFIPVNDDLRTYINPFNPECIENRQPDLRDLSYHGFDFKASVPNNILEGNINLSGNILTGPNSFKLQNSDSLHLTNNFTVFIYAKGVVEPSKLTEKFTNYEEENVSIVDNPASMSLNQYQKLWNNIGCKSILTEDSLSWWRKQDYQTVINDMKNYYKLAVNCSGDDKQNAICLPGVCPVKGKTAEKTATQKIVSESTLSDVLFKQPASITNVVNLTEMNKVISDYGGIQLLTFPGNQGIAFSIIVPRKYGPILIICGNTIYETSISTPNFMDLLIAVVYDGNALKLFLNNEMIMETAVPKIYFDNDPVLINPSNVFQGNLFSFAFYNKALSVQQVNKICKYFVKMRATGTENSTVSPDILKLVDSFALQDIPDSSPTGIKSVISQITGDSKKNGDSKKILAMQEEEEALINNKCPRIIYEDGHYYSIIQPGSNLEKEKGYSGLRDYGRNIETARMIFETNFPKCPLPEILDRNKYKGDLKECPFVLLNNENPCNKYECRDTDWKKGVPENDQCRKSVDSYCNKYANVDDNCYCWRDENKNKPECLKWRGKFDDPEKCDFRKYPIDKHPDASKYIRKDKIPCWGCNLTAPESTGEFKCRKGSGGR